MPVTEIWNLHAQLWSAAPRLLLPVRKILEVAAVWHVAIRFPSGRAVYVQQRAMVGEAVRIAKARCGRAPRLTDPLSRKAPPLPQRRMVTASLLFINLGARITDLLRASTAGQRPQIDFVGALR
jgi:hypothetical protein